MLALPLQFSVPHTHTVLTNLGITWKLGAAETDIDLDSAFKSSNEPGRAERNEYLDGPVCVGQSVELWTVLSDIYCTKCNHKQYLLLVFAFEEVICLLKEALPHFATRHPKCIANIQILH